MAILEGGVRFLVEPFIIGILRFYGLCPLFLASGELCK